MQHTYFFLDWIKYKGKTLRVQFLPTRYLTCECYNKKDFVENGFVRSNSGNTVICREVNGRVSKTNTCLQRFLERTEATKDEDNIQIEKRKKVAAWEAKKEIENCRRGRYRNTQNRDCGPGIISYVSPLSTLLQFGVQISLISFRYCGTKDLLIRPIDDVNRCKFFFKINSRILEA